MVSPGVSPRACQRARPTCFGRRSCADARGDPARRHQAPRGFANALSSVLPEDAQLPDVFRAFPSSAAPLLELHEALMRGPFPFSAGERELIAAYVSALNACAYCTGVHGATAAAFGLEEGPLESMIEDLESADVSAKLRPVLRSAAKPTLAPNGMTRQDAAAVHAVHWPEQALYDTVAICAPSNFMNRLVLGRGIRAGSDYFAAVGRRLHDTGYAAMIDLPGPAR